MFGDVVIILFLVSQALDGVLTYLGFKQFGVNIEANPLISSVVPILGQGFAVAAAKLLAAGFGITLHLRGVHRAVAALSALYVAVAIVPWMLLLQ